MKHPIQPVAPDAHGVLRFKENKIVSHLLEVGRRNGCGLNELACMDFSQEDREQFAQLIGYSLSGWGTLSYVSDESYAAAQALADGVKPSRVLPHPGSPEASAMMDAMLAEYQWPANTKNAARAGWEAANRWLTQGNAGVLGTDCTEPNRAACPRKCIDFCNRAEQAAADARGEDEALREALAPGVLGRDSIERAADFLEQYAAFIHRVKPDEIEEHPYLPELEQVAADLRAHVSGVIAPGTKEADFG